MQQEQTLSFVSTSSFFYPWLVREEKVNYLSKDFNREVLRKYLADASAILKKEIEILSQTDLDFDYEQEQKLRSLFNSVVSARRVYQEEHFLTN